ncbi:helix-turn-helix transcriptional regulator [Paenibacillus albidus]|uniref:AraC family transcriptional regulator n=1 Tax=Paenibacillus albidus TaxID=2041023 RepID=UPI001BEBC6B5|nr:AraC family transcriptional regulator [Paenibacillus albidus]MBT2290219.1 helix-turn-helix transcriptional regulator [Paenibacillus albidus]
MQNSIVFEGNYFFDSYIPVRIKLTKEMPFTVRHEHDFVEIAYVYEGEGIHHIEDKCMLVSKGDLFIIPPGVSHVFQPLDLTGESPLYIMNCLYKPYLDKPFCRNNVSAWSLFHERHHEFRNVFEEMKCNQLNGSPQLISSQCTLLNKLFYILYCSEQLEDYNQIEVNEYAIHKAIQYMGAHFKDSLPLEKISQLVSMSTRNFQRLFKNSTGVSYIQMLQDIRILYSCNLLKYSAWSIQTIAHTIGIEDMKYFYRLFGERCGTTPGEYRQHQGNINLVLRGETS